MEVEPEEEEIAMTTEGLGFSALFGFGKKIVCGERVQFRVRLNKEKTEDESALSHSTRSQLQRRCVFHGGCGAF